MKAKIIGITGSNGKTSTKEFTATLLKQKFKVCYSQGSFNNHWGVPMSLMNLSPDDDVAVIEMGMNHLGEIKELCKIAEPDCVLITNIGSSHVGEVGGLENIVKAKEEIFKHSPGAIKIFNLDSPSIYKMFLNYKSSGPYFCFSKKDASADVHLEVINANAESLELRGIISRQQIQAVVPVFGSHNVENLMAACGVALALEMIPQEIQQGLGECKTIWGRNQFLKLKSGTTILFDAYNANPESMDQLLKNVDQLKIIGKKWAVIGEMLELGEESEIQHRELAQKMKRQNWAGVWFIGQNQEVFRESLKGAKFEKNLYLSSTYEEKLASLVQNMLNPNDMVVFKGSRGHKLEQILRAWEPGII